MKKFKKVTASVLILGMTLSAAACGGKTDATKANATTGDAGAQTTAAPAAADYKAGDQFKSEKPVSYSLLYSDHENYPTQDNWLLWDRIKELTNVTLDLSSVARTDFEQKRTLLVSTGQAPLIIPKTYPGSEVAFIASGAILTVSDYLDYMPNFKDKVEKWGMEADLETIKQADGKFYVLPGLHEGAGGGYSYMIRKDIFEKAGITIDEATYTYENLYTDMKKIKAANPDKYVFSDRFTGQSLLSTASKMFGVTAGWSKGSGAKYDATTDQFFYTPTSDKYKVFLSYFSKLKEEGLLDPESFVQTDDQAVAKFTTGQSFVISANTQLAQDMMSKLETSLGAGNYEIALITQPGGPEGQLQQSSGRLENGVMISSKALDLGEKEFEKFMNFIDWLWYSDDGQELVKWGVEGKTFTVKDGKRVLNSDIYYNGINKDATKKLNVDFGFSGGVFAYGGSNDLKTSMYSAFEKEFYDKTINLRTPTAIEPVAKGNEEQTEENNTISAPLMDYIDQMTLKFILGDANLQTEWDAYVKQCETKGSTKLIENINKIYKATK